VEETGKKTRCGTVDTAISGVHNVGVVRVVVVIVVLRVGQSE
jgi:hypothetical protein